MAYARSCGLSPEEFIGRNHFELYPHEENQAIFGDVVRFKRPYQAFAKPFLFPDHPEWGATYWDWTLVPILDERGEVEFLVFSLNDVTERERAIMAVRESEQLYAKAQEVGHFGHWSRDLITDDVTWSEETYRIFGVKQEEFKPTLENFLALVHPSDREPLMEGIKGSILNRKPLHTEYRILRPDGVERVIYSVSELRQEESGRRLGLIGTLHDITERKRAEDALKVNAERLEVLNQDLQEFAFVASHDLQEPLRKIQSFASRLKTKCGSTLGEDGCDYLSRMESAASRMSSLLSALLAYSRVRTRTNPWGEINLEEVAHEVVSDLELMIERTGGCIEVGALPVIEADKAQMYQLLQNLVGNALKYKRESENPIIRIDGVAVSGVARIVVEDNGIGFDEKYLDRIFKPFQRLHGRGAFEGTGMGLAIARKIVERHGGTITATSVPGVGSTFIITLPVRQKSRTEDDPGLPESPSCLKRSP
jgi:PAS domain S-box-containing protein